MVTPFVSSCSLALLSGVMTALVWRWGYRTDRYREHARAVRERRWETVDGPVDSLADLAGWLGDSPSRAPDSRTEATGKTLWRAATDRSAVEGMRDTLDFLHEPKRVHRWCIEKRDAARRAFLGAGMGYLGVAVGLLYADQSVVLALFETALFSVSTVGFALGLFRGVQVFLGRRELERMAAQPVPER